MTATAAAASDAGEEEDDLPLLLAATWRLLLDTAARLPPTQRSRRLLRQFEKFGPGWLASLVSALERNALPVSAPRRRQMRRRSRG